jgi:hypothetical protein
MSGCQCVMVTFFGCRFAFFLMSNSNTVIRIHTYNIDQRAYVPGAYTYGNTIRRREIIKSEGEKRGTTNTDHEVALTDDASLAPTSSVDSFIFWQIIARATGYLV